MGVEAEAEAKAKEDYKDDDEGQRLRWWSGVREIGDTGGT